MTKNWGNLACREKEVYYSCLGIADIPNWKNHVLTRESHVSVLEEFILFLQNRAGKHLVSEMGTYFGVFVMYRVMSIHSFF